MTALAWALGAVVLALATWQAWRVLRPILRGLRSARDPSWRAWR